MKTIILRASVENENSYKTGQLEEAFETMHLVSATACEDYIVYVFGNKDPDVGRTAEGS
jgi:hypothetical protein